VIRFLDIGTRSPSGPLTMPRSRQIWSGPRYRVPKHGNTEAECEDACAGDPQTGRFAVVDGESESAFARPWPKPWRRHTFPIAARGRPGYLLLAQLAAAISGRSNAVVNIEAKFQEGAFSTLLGVAFAGNGTWLAQP